MPHAVPQTHALLSLSAGAFPSLQLIVAIFQIYASVLGVLMFKAEMVVVSGAI